MGITKFDYRLNDKHTIFGRYFAAHEASPPSQGVAAATPQTILSSVVAAGTDDLVQSGVLGDTYSFGPTAINSFRVTVNRTAIQKFVSPQFTPVPTLEFTSRTWNPSAFIRTLPITSPMADLRPPVRSSPRIRSPTISI